MRKTIYVLLFVLFCAARASAQFTLVSGTVNDVNGLAYSCATLSASIVNLNGQNLYLSGALFSPQPGATKLGCPTDPTTSRTAGAFSLQLADNTQIKCGSGASIVTCATQTQWLFTVNTTGTPPPLGTGPQVCTSQFTISGASQAITFSCPALSTISPAGGSSTINATAFGVQATGFFVCDAGITNASNIITTTSTDPPFTGNAVRNAQVGDVVWASAATCGGEDTGDSVNPTTLVPKSTITSVDSAHQVHVSTPASATCTVVASDHCVFVWGPDSDANMQTAWAATGNGCAGNLVMPAGNIIMHTPPTATINCTTTTSGNGSPLGFTLSGQGQYSTLILWDPTTTFGNCAFTMLPGNGGFFYMRYHDFGMASFTAAPAAANGKAGLCTTSIYNEIDHIFLNEYFPSTSQNFTGISATGCGNCGHNLHDLILESGGSTGISMLGDHIFLTNSIIQNSPISNVAAQPTSPGTIVLTNVASLLGGNGGGANGGGLVFNSGGGPGAVLIAKNSTFVGGNQPSNAGDGCAIQGNAGSTFIMQDTQCNSAATVSTATGLRVAAGNIVSVEGSRNLMTVAQANETALVNAGTISLRNATMTGVGTGFAMNNSGTVIVKEGNTFTNGITNTGTITGQQNQGMLYGSCTGTATAAQTLTLFGLGEVTATTCTATGAGTIGQVMSKSGTAYGLFVQAGTAGVAAGSGVFTVFLNHNGTNTAQALTCTVGTGTSCNDGTAAHAFAYVAGDIITVQFTTQAAETLANLRAQVITQ